MKCAKQNKNIHKWHVYKSATCCDMLFIKAHVRLFLFMRGWCVHVHVWEHYNWCSTAIQPHQWQHFSLTNSSDHICVCVCVKWQLRIECCCWRQGSTVYSHSWAQCIMPYDVCGVLMRVNVFVCLNISLAVHTCIPSALVCNPPLTLKE